MNRFFIKIFAFTLAVMAVTLFAGCDNETSSQVDTTVPTTAIETTEAPSSDITTDIKALHYFDNENGDVFAGAWKITEGTGSQLEGFVFLFDGNGKATLVIDNMGYLESYTLDESKKTVTVQLLFGLNGTYSYKFDGENKVELTNTEDNTNTVMEKLDEFSMLPKAVENPQIDENLLGAWLSESGEYLYFGADGIMYQNQYGMTITYSNYTAKESTLTSTYSMQDELTDTYKYSVDGETLMLDEFEYTRIPASDLI